MTPTVTASLQAEAKKFKKKSHKLPLEGTFSGEYQTKCLHNEFPGNPGNAYVEYCCLKLFTLVWQYKCSLAAPLRVVYSSSRAPLARSEPLTTRARPRLTWETRGTQHASGKKRVRSCATPYWTGSGVSHARRQNIALTFIISNWWFDTQAHFVSEF